VRQWKIASSLAIVGAIAGPFVFGSYKANPYTSGFLPLPPAQKEEVAAYLARQNNCEEFFDFDIPMERSRERDECFERLGLLRNGEYYSYFSLPQYLALNAVFAVAGFLSIFGLVMVFPAGVRFARGAVRRYWKWLNT
jgi:hypothetical protein